MLTLFESYLKGYKVLYHYTQLALATRIMDSGKFILQPAIIRGENLASIEPQFEKGRYFYMSTARSPNNAFTRLAKDRGCMFVLDGDAIQRRHRIMPTNYFAHHVEHDPMMDEKEDRILSKRPFIPIDGKIIDSIHLMGDAYNILNQGYIKSITTQAKKLNIPTYVYRNYKDFLILNHRRAISGEEWLKKDYDTITTSKATSPANNSDLKALEYYLTLATAKLDKGQKPPRSLQLLYLNLMASQPDAIRNIELAIEKVYMSEPEKTMPLFRFMRKNRMKSVEDFHGYIEKKWKESGADPL